MIVLLELRASAIPVSSSVLPAAVGIALMLLEEIVKPSPEQHRVYGLSAGPAMAGTLCYHAGGVDHNPARCFCSCQTCFLQRQTVKLASHTLWKMARYCMQPEGHTLYCVQAPFVATNTLSVREVYPEVILARDAYIGALGWSESSCETVFTGTPGTRQGACNQTCTCEPAVSSALQKGYACAGIGKSHFGAVFTAQKLLEGRDILFEQVE